MPRNNYTLPMEFAKAWKWAAFVTALFLLNYMARSTLSPVLVNLEQSLQVGHAAATSLLLMQGIGFAASQALAGYVVGRVAPAKVAAGCLVASGMCLLCMYFVDSLNTARGLFLIFGALAGLYFPAGMATLSSLVHLKDWGKTVAIHELAPNVGFILIPLLAQGALLFTDWRGAFMIMGSLSMVVGGLFLRFGRGGETLAPRPSLKSSAAILRSPVTWSISLLLAVAMCGEFSVFSVLPLFLVSEAGFDAATANGLASLSRLATPLAVFFGGWAADRFPALRVLAVGMVVHALSLVLMALPSSGFVLTGICLQAFSTAICFPSLFKAISQCTDMDNQAMLLSMTMPPAALLSAGLTPWFFGLCGEYFTFGAGFLTLGAVTLVSLLALPWLRPAAR